MKSSTTRSNRRVVLALVDSRPDALVPPHRQAQAHASDPANMPHVDYEANDTARRVPPTANKHFMVTTDDIQDDRIPGIGQ